MYTSFGMIALVGFLATPTPTPEPRLVWWRDYNVAQEKGVQESKPLAVFVGGGPGGYQGLVKEGQLTDPIKKVLVDNYVCVFLDTQAASQANLIRSMAVTKGVGLILSDRTGNIQAFHYDGVLAQAELAKQLQHFAEPNLEIRTTLSNTAQRTSYYSRPAVSTSSC